MVFQRQLLANQEMVLGLKKVDPSHIQRTVLFTVEGGRDDIAAPGQTYAAHALCSNLVPELHFHHLEIKSGHYGIFEGRR